MTTFTTQDRQDAQRTWLDDDSNISMIGGIHPKLLKAYLDNLEKRIVELENRSSASSNAPTE
jgi:hypothetical protein